MLSPDSQWRIDLARQIATRYNLIVCMVLDANAQYRYFRFQHFQQIIETLEHKPANMMERITPVLSVAPTEALPIAVQLVEDTFNIVETQGYDINNARTHFKTERKANIQSIAINEEINNA